MKRYGNLWPRIIDFENLLLAARKAQKGKRFRDNVLEFNHNLDTELIQLQAELASQTYCPSTYHTFEIFEPKRRLISAAPYPDRVVHHALCTIITPILEETLIHHTYANRIGFGTHRALRHFTHLARSHPYVLQCDIRKYYPAIDHEILKQRIRRKIKCPSTLWLIDTLIDRSNPQEPVLDYFPGDDLLTPSQRRRGLPIGNLTSQLFANYYLSGFDQFVQNELRISSYIRYVDDFALFHSDRSRLAAARPALEAYLARLRLNIHPIKSQLFETRHGANFVGFRIFPTHSRVRSGNLRLARHRLPNLQTAYHQGQISSDRYLQSIRSWFAHLQHADTWQLRHKILQDLALCADRILSSASIQLG
jgi:retron-type reverse transcriptase